MKNQYFGDFGDYQKFSLLKALRDVGCFVLTVHWMKTQDDGSTDGKRTSYLNNPELWASFDKEVFDFIKGHVDSGKRDLSLYEQSVHASGVRFLSDHIEDARKRRELLEAVCRDKKSNIVFFDPDNGVEVKSTNPKNAHKYVLWSDIETAFSSSKSVLVYQHFSRKSRDTFIREKVAEFRKRFDTDVFVIQVKHSVYFLLAQEVHSLKIRQSLADFSKIWGSLASVRNPRKP